MMDDSKLPPWKKNSMQNQKQQQVINEWAIIFLCAN
jgi:hypothetical protein